MRYFNTSGPCDPSLHYMIPAIPRLAEAGEYIRRGLYFVVHAPRQTGKTTTMMALAKEMTAEGKMAVLHFSCEAAHTTGEDFARAERIILDEMMLRSQELLPEALRPPAVWPQASEGMRLRSALNAWAKQCPRSLALVFDEVDSLEGKSLISVLRQLRAGFPDRPSAFPASVVLCGMRDVRDYRVASGGDPSRLGTASPFNVKVESFKLSDFTHEQVEELYLQHSSETGQRFEPRAIERAFELTRGQPWLVNALAREIVEKMAVPASTPVSISHIEDAKERLILARATHLDSLVARLSEARVRHILAPVIAGDESAVETPPGAGPYDDDRQYVVDLGLIASRPPLRIANPIYREVIVRVLGTMAEDRIDLEPRTFVLPNGRLDMRLLLAEFQKFWKRNGDVLAGKMPYHEVAPQLVLMAWLQRVVNGGGFVEREYGVGRGRIDLLVRWPIWKSECGMRNAEVAENGGRRLAEAGWQEEAVELKVWGPKRPDPLEEGLEQIDEYLRRLSLPDGYLVIFDRRRTKRPEKRTYAFEDAVTPSGKKVLVMRA